MSTKDVASANRSPDIVFPATFNTVATVIHIDGRRREKMMEKKWETMKEKRETMVATED